MNWVISLLVFSTLLTAADSPRIFYSREMPGSEPAYAQIVVERDGSASYRESVDDPDEQPVEFRLRPKEVDAIFDLADKLDHFRNPLESNLKVANMGIKTFRWEDSTAKNEQKFNFSKDLDARVLADWFARMTDVARHFIHLERAAQFDKLGVNKALLSIQVMVERDRLVAGDLFLPLLDKVANNESYLNMARTRAADLADLIRASGEPAQ